MLPIPDSHRDLAEAPVVASLATVSTSGVPQVTAVWFLADDDSFRLSVTSDRQKYKNMVANPFATLFVIDTRNPFRTLEIRGTVEAGVDAGLELFKAVFRHYGQDPDAGGAPLDGRVAITLRPTRIVTQG